MYRENSRSQSPPLAAVRAQPVMRACGNASREGTRRASRGPLFRAYCKEARDIGDPTVLADIARSHEVSGSPGQARREEVQGNSEKSVPAFAATTIGRLFRESLVRVCGVLHRLGEVEPRLEQDAVERDRRALRQLEGRQRLRSQ